MKFRLRRGWYMENNTWACVDMEFLFECLTWLLISECSEGDVELNMRRKISYLQGTVYYFVYHINTIALYWEEKPTSLMYENKWINNPQMTIIECVGAYSWDGKMCWIMITKTTMVVIFNLQNSHLLTLSLLTERFEVFIFIYVMH